MKTAPSKKESLRLQAIRWPIIIFLLMLLAVTLLVQRLMEKDEIVFPIIMVICPIGLLVHEIRNRPYASSRKNSLRHRKARS